MSALINETQPQSGGTAKNLFALQMLAQVAPENALASEALLQQAKAGQIPDRAWRRIADALAGDQYQYNKDPSMDLNSLMRTPGAKLYHIGNSEENFYSTPLVGKASDEDLSQRRALVDQLLASASTPTASEALQRAKTQLSPGRQ